MISNVAADFWREIPDDLKNFPTFTFSKKIKEYLLSEQLTKI